MLVAALDNYIDRLRIQNRHGGFIREDVELDISFAETVLRSIREWPIKEAPHD